MPVRVRKLKHSLKRALKRSTTLRRTYFRLMSLHHGARLKGAGLHRGSAEDARTEGVNPENVVWNFCTGRSGSTWLRGTIEELAACKVWEEPKVGQLFGEFYDSARESRLVSTNFVMCDPTRKG